MVTHRWYFHYDAYVRDDYIKDINCDGYDDLVVVLGKSFE